MRVAKRHVTWCRTEYDMLRKTQEFILEYKPVVVVGYNTNNFDFSIVVTAAKSVVEEHNTDRRFNPCGLDLLKFPPHTDASAIAHGKQRSYHWLPENIMAWSLCGHSVSIKRQTIRTAQAGSRQKNKVQNCHSFISLDLLVYALEYIQELSQCVP